MNEVSRIGHNAPPIDAFPTREQLEYENEELIRRRDELIAAAERVPPIEDEEIARRVGDFIKQIAAAGKSAEAARVKAKEPYLEGARYVDGFFKAISDPLEKAKRAIEARLTLYLREKAATERRDREERERLAREEAGQRRQEAEEAERILRDEKSLAAAVEAERLRKQADADADRAAREAVAKPAELSRVRGEYGSVASLRTVWTFDGLDRTTLDLEALRAHIPRDGLERAVRSFVKAGGRELRGVRIFEESNAAVR